ncbi:hypothetical protein BGZ49_006726 [Haplosporangium sp. Z 27]|nr:hypothetical protein BGZ49_006726 [Haplosporangium sp. Z 27]
MINVNYYRPKLLVSNLSWNTTDEVLRQAFSVYGQVIDVIVMKESISGRSRGFGYVTFSSDGEAEAAISGLNNQDLDGRKISISHAPANSGSQGGYNASQGSGYDWGSQAKVFVGGLSWGTTDDSLREGFGIHGEVTDAIVVKDRETGRSRGFGFVTFADADSAEEAIKRLNNQDFEGRQIKVDRASERTDSAPRNNFRGRGGYRNNDQGGYGNGYNQPGRSDGDWTRQ